MAKSKGSGAALALIALIIGAGGIGFAFYTWYTQPKAPQIWGLHSPAIYVPPVLSYGMVMFIEFDLKTNSSVQLLYTCSAQILPETSSYSDVFFKFMIDDELLNNPYTRAGPYQGQSYYDFIPVTLQHFIENMGSGYHNISVQALQEHGGDNIREHVFTITAYPL
jgi:hypothetical protein